MPAPLSLEFCPLIGYNSGNFMIFIVIFPFLLVFRKRCAGLWLIYIKHHSIRITQRMYFHYIPGSYRIGGCLAAHCHGVSAQLYQCLPFIHGSWYHEQKQYVWINACSYAITILYSFSNEESIAIGGVKKDTIKHSIQQQFTRTRPRWSFG